ncbi:ATP-binding cassette domain-containing protein [Cryobacterium sp. MLB-32]|uniref:ATP-binding cassette domain-containing protein n=1 Tax=Cryobacterium sp. MLB-32 TaxID=1529318 RepID=UPI00068D5A2F|nr:ATP-binding cassette domain-containing protein [Cryobacterium sp. MLB-32]
MFRLRPGPLRAAALFAMGFVLVRVVYRVLFGGAGGGTGAVLLDLPLLRLGGPFSHVAFLGPITTTGLGNAALSALPVAAIILFFGVLNATIDVRRFFARGAGRGPVRTVSRALVIAWATFPALLEAVRRVRVAGALRGERSISALLVPVFEQTIERALALAASMESRGFAATERAEGACDRPVVMTDASLGFTGQWRLDNLSFALVPGTLTVITGATGSGKTSLLHSMSGLFQHFHEGTQNGRIEVAGVDRATTPPRDTAGFVGLVSQNVRLGFAAETVHDEIGFALAVRGVAPVIVQERVREVAARLDIEHLLPRPIDALSAGEASLVAIGAALISRPILLLVDEPLADLDANARVRVCGVLDALAHEAQVCVVVAEHNTREFEAITDAWLAIRGNSVHVLGRDTIPRELAPPELPAPPVLAAPRSESRSGSDTPSPGGATSANPLASIRHLSVTHGATRAVDDVSLSIERGDLVALCGSNGAGKSTLLQAIALPTATCTVWVGGRDVHALTRHRRRSAVALVPENFDDLLFALTVAEECRRADRTSRATGAVTAQTFARLLGLDSGTAVSGLLHRHPRDLSAGERLCLVMAIQLSANPALLLVDEPTRGLDARARTLVGDALRRAAERTTGSTGSAVMFATHDHEFAQKLATRRIHMREARLVAEPAAVTR